MLNLKLMLRSTLVAGGFAMLSACSSVNDEQVSEVDQVRTRYENLASNEQVNQYAPLALENAKESLHKLEGYVEDGKSDFTIDNQMAMTRTQLDIVDETLRYKLAQSYIDDADSTRKDILLQARTNEAINAKRQAREMEQKANQLQNRASQLESDLANASIKADSLKDQLDAKQTERGMILSLKNILFETNKAKLLPGYENTLEKVSEFLNEYPERDLVVEGHTDSTGEAAYNKTLSKQRAQAVEQALVEYGVDDSRISVKGMGEEAPIASNDTREGRQLNRRVDIVIENKMQKDSVATN